MIEVRPCDPTLPELSAFLRRHLQEMHAVSPPESTHALDPSRLDGAEPYFIGAWEGDELLGCAALRELDPHHGEVKAMRTAPEHRRRGVARLLLERVIDEATARGYRRLSLETGSGEPFAAALAFYRDHGFEPCRPFADYRDDPFSRFMTLRLPP